MYRGVHNERRVLFMNEDDMRERGVRKGDVLDLTSHFKGQRRCARRFVAVPYRLQRGN